MVSLFRPDQEGSARRAGYPAPVRVKSQPHDMPQSLPHESATLNRRYDMSWLEADGTIGDASRVAPASPAFEEAFAAFGRGTLISTQSGPVAVEDLLPGTLVETVGAGWQPLLWVGGMTLAPRSSGSSGKDATRLIRISADTFGAERPGPDLILGPRARLLYRHARCREVIGRGEAFAPARAFADGVGIIEVTPVSPVQTFHLALCGQHAVLANGIEVETYHPGGQVESMMSPDMLALFMSLFPHVSGADGFGPMTVPRLTAFELETMQAA